MRRFVAFGLVFFTVLAVVFGSVSPTEAVVIIVDITARVVSVIDLEDFLDGAVVPGDTITGRYIFDTTVSDRNDAFIAAEYVYLGFPYGIDLTVVGCCRFRTDPDNTAFTIEIVNREPGAGQDAFLMNSELNIFDISAPGESPINSISWLLTDSSGEVFSFTALPLVPILAEYDFKILAIESEEAITGDRFTISAEVTSAEVSFNEMDLLLGLPGSKVPLDPPGRR
jgi:hypothetical protein